MRDDWTIVQIEKVFSPIKEGNDLNQGYSPQCKKTPSPSEDIWGVLKTTAIQRNDFWADENKELPPEKEIKEQFEVNSGDILITCAGPRNRCGVSCVVKKVRKRLLLSGKMYRFRANETIINTDFLSLYLQSQEAWNAIDKMKTGGNESGLNLTHSRFRKLPVKIAPLPEQRAIVAKIEQLFSELDKGIASLREAKSQLAIYRQAVLKKAFEGELTGTDNIKWVTINDICSDVEYGSAAKSKKEGLVPVLRMGNIQNGRFDWADLVYSDNPQEIEKYTLFKDDVLFNRTNSPEWVGKTAIYKGEMPAIFAGYLIRINYDKDKIDPNYLNYFLNSHTAKQHGNRVKSFGVNQANINGTKLKGYPFPITDIDSQKQIVQEIESRLSVCDQLVNNIDQSLEKAEALRQSILKKAFEGNILTEQELIACCAEPDYSPASELLTSINGDH